MAISGMHIGMFAVVAGWLAGRVQRWRQRRGARGTARDAAVIVGSVAALAYGALAGWSVPTQRTAIMIAIVAFALRARRRIGAGDALALGAIAVLVLEPLAPLAVGFWLSFGAVAAILLVTGGQLGRSGVVRGYAQAQWAVSGGLVPVLAGSFGAVSIVSVVVNMLAIPLYTLVVVPLVLVGTALLMAWPALGAPLLRVADQIEILGVKELIFFTRSFADDENVKPYIDCIKFASLKVGINLKIIELPTNDDYGQGNFKKAF